MKRLPTTHLPFRTPKRSRGTVERSEATFVAPFEYDCPGCNVSGTRACHRLQSCRYASLYRLLDIEPNNEKECAFTLKPGVCPTALKNALSSLLQLPPDDRLVDALRLSWAILNRDHVADIANLFDPSRVAAVAADLRAMAEFASWAEIRRHHIAMLVT